MAGGFFAIAQAAQEARPERAPAWSSSTLARAATRSESAVVAARVSNDRAGSEKI